jgi:phosphopantothenoylcysteine decarboxylase/phosphopantothenate--cysteine ligase
VIPAHYLFDTFHGKRIHLGITGSVAAYKALDLTRAFLHLHLLVGVTMTEAAQKFVTDLSFRALGAEPLYTSMFADETRFDHLEPSVADAFVVAPATANTLAKMACGIADDLLSCQLLACPGPMLVAPAMNPRMWNAAATRHNWSILRERGVILIEPDHGSVACGDTGQGRLAPLDEIFIRTLAALSPQDLRGKKILLTLGPTREYFDKARFWSNPSTGVMGACLAIAAALRGAEVTAVLGPTDISLPTMIRRVPVVTAREMFEAASDIFPSQDIGCFTAAVADFRPPSCPTGKYKKSTTPLSLTFEPNADILANVSSAKMPGQQTIGFAAESESVEENAAQKLAKKNLDLIIANRIDEPGSGFASPTNRVLVMDRHGRKESWPQLPKTEVAWRIWDWISMNTP